MRESLHQTSLVRLLWALSMAVCTIYILEERLAAGMINGCDIGKINERNDMTISDCLHVTVLGNAKSEGVYFNGSWENGLFSWASRDRIILAGCM